MYVQVHVHLSKVWSLFVIGLRAHQDVQLPRYICVTFTVFLDS